MKLVRYSDPFAELDALHSQLDKMFNETFDRSTTHVTPMPSMDVYSEDGKHLIAEVQAPGFSKDDIAVHINQGMLEVKGEKKSKEEEKGKNRRYMVRESSATFYRRIALPKQADINNIKAEYENGTLKISVPFQELPAPKKVQITAKDQ